MVGQNLEPSLRRGSVSAERVMGNKGAEIRKRPVMEGLRPWAASVVVSSCTSTWRRREKEWQVLKGTSFVYSYQLVPKSTASFTESHDQVGAFQGRVDADGCCRSSAQRSRWSKRGSQR